MNLGNLARLRVGSISGRLMGQALFGEAIVLGVVLGVFHRRAGRPGRGALMGTAALGLLAIYVEAYRVEPNLLRVREHHVDRAQGAAGLATVRILHITDIQTPAIGPREDLAFRTGLSYRPDLIVLTGDYVQDELGRPSEEQAARDLRALIVRVAFQAPLGVFATEGDAGPSCRDVFSGTAVRCLVDESALVTLPGGDTLAITGLSRGGGRQRDSGWLERLLRRGPQGDHQIVISHSPDFVDSLREPVDLVLAGHTHGGQVVLPILGPPKTSSRLPRAYAGGAERLPRHPAPCVAWRRHGARLRRAGALPLPARDLRARRDAAGPSLVGPRWRCILNAREGCALPVESRSGG